MELLANATLDLTAFIAVLLLFLSGKRDRQTDDRQIIFDRMLLCLMCFLLVDFLAWYVDGLDFTCAYAVQMALNSLVWLTQAVYSYLWLLYAERWVRVRREKIAKRKKAHVIPLCVQAGLLVANVFTGWVFTISDRHLYTHGTLYPHILLIFYVYGMLAFFVTVRAFFAAADSEQRKNCLWMSAFMVLPCLFSVIRIFAYGISLISPIYALSLLMIYLNVHQRRMLVERDKVVKRDADLQRARISIMLSQIQPHFLYNALCVIQDLCHGAAPEAERATVAFSRFLRGNLDSLNADKPIPFAQELEHTEYYLTLEGMRFGARLKVEYDIGASLFRVPAMTLQPIVENAVRYGVMQREAGGMIKISSAELEKNFVVTVEDDGVGFEPGQKHDDGRTHIGIDNVRQRLREMCGGELKIASMPGAGTIATILIPKEGCADVDLRG